MSLGLTHAMHFTKDDGILYLQSPGDPLPAFEPVTGPGVFYLHLHLPPIQIPILQRLRQVRQPDPICSAATFCLNRDSLDFGIPGFSLLHMLIPLLYSKNQVILKSGESWFRQSQCRDYYGLVYVPGLLVPKLSNSPTLS